MNTIIPNVLTISTYSGFAPVCSVKADGVTACGKDISFLEEFAAAKGLKIVWKVLPKFEGIWLEPGKDSCDIAAAGITALDERKEAAGEGVDWSSEYFHVQRSFLIRAGDAFETISDFTSAHTIAVTKDSTADTDIKARNPNGAKVVRNYSVQSEAVDALLNGVIDAFGEGDVSNDYLKTLRPNLRVIDRHEMKAGTREPFSFPVRAASGVRKALNDWLATTSEEHYRNIKWEP